MSLHFILDGYNVIKQTAPLADMDIQSSRLYLIRWLETYHPQGSLRNQATVVFDGHVSVGGYPQYQSSSVKVLFSYDESADDVIKRMVAESENKKSIVVVTNDREIQYFVKGLGAQILEVQNFLEKGEKSGGAASGKSGTTKNLSRTTQDQINAELEKIWLNKKDDVSK
ncbi:MAG: NYN domain-containing protein [Candidatus Omnitrophica bacterium]|nr:NYN domain-containing protein [Candidatus Omnitrophota bacterium]